MMSDKSTETEAETIPTRLMTITIELREGGDFPFPGKAPHHEQMQTALALWSTFVEAYQSGCTLALLHPQPSPDGGRTFEVLEIPELEEERSPGAVLTAKRASS